MSREHGTDVVLLLSDYHAVTQQLLDLVRVAEEMPDLEQMDKLLAERERLLEAHRQFKDNNREDDPNVRAKWQDIQQAEAAISDRLDSLRAAMQGKMTNLQKQKLGLNAYRQGPIYGAAFIDRRK